MLRSCWRKSRASQFWFSRVVSVSVLLLFVKLPAAAEAQTPSNLSYSKHHRGVHAASHCPLVARRVDGHIIIGRVRRAYPTKDICLQYVSGRDVSRTRRRRAERELSSELHYSGVNRRGLFSRAIRLGLAYTYIYIYRFLVCRYARSLGLAARQNTPAIDAAIYRPDSTLYQLQPSFHKQSTEPEPTARARRAGEEFYSTTPEFMFVSFRLLVVESI